VPARPSRRALWLFLIILFEVIVLGVVGAVAAFEYRFTGRIYEGVTVAGIPLGGMSVEAAERQIEEEMTPYPGERVIVRYGDRTWVFSPGDLGVAVDARATAALAYAVGRQASSEGLLSKLRTNLSTQAQAFAAGRELEPVLKYDEGKIELILRDITEEVDLPPREASLVVNGLEIRSTPGYAGRALNVAAAREILTVLARNGAGGVVDLEVEERRPAIHSAEAAAEQAKKLLSAPIILTAEGINGQLQFAVDRAMMSEWLVFTPVANPDGTLELTVQADREKIATFLQTIAKQTDLPAYDARLDFDPDSGEVVVLNPSTTGQKLDIEVAAAELEKALLAGERALTLPVVTVAPKVDSSKVAEMGIVELVSAGTTYFKGSSPERVANIVTAAEKFQGVVIPPGEQFSFNQHVGDVNAANGFVDSLIIRGDRTEVGVGGGVCQVSTTAFQAAFWGGFPILERYPHSYLVGYYNPPGLDATIYTPTADFRFRNDTDSYLLIRPEVDKAKSQITFYLYGTKDRTAEMVGKPVISNVKKPEGPIYEENKDLPAGKIKQVDWAKDGMDVVVTRRVTFDDGQVKEDRIASKYRPWRAVYQYGPGTEIPAGG
jgi:vancomycin resistance protein YoaR